MGKLLDTFCDRLEFARKHAGLSKAGMARALRTSNSTVTNLLSGKTKTPTGPLLAAVEMLTGVSADWIMTGEGNRFIERTVGAQAAIECPVVRHHNPTDRRPPDAMVVVPLSMAWSVLESQTTTSKALKLNIEELYDKVHGSPGQAYGVDNGGNVDAGNSLKTPVGGKGRKAS